MGVGGEGGAGSSRAALMSEERLGDGQTGSPAFPERAAWLSGALLSIVTLLSVLTIPTLRRDSQLE